MKRIILSTILVFILIGCSGNNRRGNPKKEKIAKDTIDIEAIVYGVRDGDLTIKYFSQSGKQIEYEFNDTLNIELSYKSKFTRLNNNHDLTVIPLTENLEVFNTGHNKYQLLIDSSKNLNEFRYEVDLSSDECLFRNTYPKLNFSSEMALVFKTFKYR